MAQNETTLRLTKSDLYGTCFFCFLCGVAVGFSIMGLWSMP
jgi:hypothetical protein